MTENQKKLAIIGGVILLALLLLLTRKGGTTTVNQTQAPPINVSIPSLNLPDRSGVPIEIGGVTIAPFQYNAIGACMCDGNASLTPPPSQASTINIYNAANSGPNIYNNLVAPSDNGGLMGIAWASAPSVNVVGF